MPEYEWKMYFCIKWDFNKKYFSRALSVTQSSHLMNKFNLTDGRLYLMHHTHSTTTKSNHIIFFHIFGWWFVVSHGIELYRLKIFTELTLQQSHSRVGMIWHGFVSGVRLLYAVCCVCVSFSAVRECVRCSKFNSSTNSKYVLEWLCQSWSFRYGWHAKGDVEWVRSSDMFLPIYLIFRDKVANRMMTDSTGHRAPI